MPVDKKLAKGWVEALFERGAREVYRGPELDTIGMPINGIAAGQLYLCGDGSFGNWEIFNHHEFIGYGDKNFAFRTPTKPVDHGFAIAVTQGDKTSQLPLDRTGFADVSFIGEYPIGIVRYVDPALPVSVEMEAFSPFIPLNLDDSALPMTFIRLTVTNTSNAPLSAQAHGKLENAVLRYNREQGIQGLRRTRIVRDGGRAYIVHSAATLPPPAEPLPAREPKTLATFEGGSYGEWKIEGTAFGDKPATGTWPGQIPVTGHEGDGLVNSFLPNDDATGTLTSPTFVIERRFINALVGGGRNQDTTAIHLLVDGERVRTGTGQNSETLAWNSWHVGDLEGKQAVLQIVDHAKGGWGHVNVDTIELSDEPRTGPGTHDVTELHDFGTLVLAVDSDFPDPATDAEREGGVDDIWTTSVGSAPAALAPNESHTFTFILAWHMPNIEEGHYYTNRFNDAVEVAKFGFENSDRLVSQTKLWHDIYYDSTLPYWLLNRLHSTVSNLATGTTRYWKNGRFWAWEGVVCCAGTCTHVWNYAHAAARLFPQLERSVREMQDFNLHANGGGFHEDSGLVGFRSDDNYAADGQCGTILKAYREHQMSADGEFLKRNYPRIKKALEFSMGHDANDDGLIEDLQHNTFDINFFGPNTFVGSLYLAALRAGEEMAKEMGDTAFAERCRRVFEQGSRLSVEQLFNGEYFIQDVDLKEHPDHQYAEGCLADQVFGQGWAHLLDLGYIYPKERVDKALDSIWKYNWAPDVAPQNKEHPPQRWFIDPGKAGLFTCTWPKSEYITNGVLYREEVWTGIEYQVAGHMVWEGKLLEALAICRAIHDRYHPIRFNPWNEIECSDHYARALASWGVYQALQGYNYHGPKGLLTFAPKLKPEEFKSAFTTAEGWGNFSQTRNANGHTARITLASGSVRLRELGLESDPQRHSGKATLDGAEIAATVTNKEGQVRVSFGDDVVMKEGQTLEVTLV